MEEINKEDFDNMLAMMEDIIKESLNDEDKKKAVATMSMRAIILTCKDSPFVKMLCAMYMRNKDIFKDDFNDKLIPHIEDILEDDDNWLGGITVENF